MAPRMNVALLRPTRLRGIGVSQPDQGVIDVSIRRLQEDAAKLLKLQTPHAERVRMGWSPERRRQ